MVTRKPPFNFDKKSPAEKLNPVEEIKPREPVANTDHFLGLQTCHSPAITMAVPAGYDLGNQSFYWYETSIAPENKTYPTFPAAVKGVSVVCSNPNLCTQVLMRLTEASELHTATGVEALMASVTKAHASDWYSAMLQVRRDGEPDLTWGLFDHESHDPLVFVLRNGDYGGGAMIGSLKTDLQPLLAKCTEGKDAVILAASAYPPEDIVVYSVNAANQVEKLYLHSSEVQKEGEKIKQTIALINAPVGGHA